MIILPKIKLEIHVEKLFLVNNSRYFEAFFRWSLGINTNLDMNQIILLQPSENDEESFLKVLIKIYAHRNNIWVG